MYKVVEGKVFTVATKERTARGIWKSPYQGVKIGTLNMAMSELGHDSGEGGGESGRRGKREETERRGGAPRESQENTWPTLQDYIGLSSCGKGSP